MSKQMRIKDWLEGCQRMCVANGFDPHNLEKCENVALVMFGIELNHALQAYHAQDREAIIISLPHVASAGMNLCSELEGEVGWKEIFQTLKGDIENFRDNVPEIQARMRQAMGA